MKIKALKKYKDNDGKGSNFENLLFTICIICFIALVIIQIILMVPSVREYLNLTDKSIGVPLGGDEYLYGRGQITLKMNGTQPDPEVQVLVNGDTVQKFDNLMMNIEVKDGDVIEIDGTQSSSGHIITVDEISSNINSTCKNSVARVESNFQRLLKVKFN
jgi:hypothetical protein